MINMKNKKAIIITAIVLIVLIAIIAGFAISNSKKNTHKDASKDVQASSTTETTESTEATTEKKTDPAPEEEGTQNTDSSTKDEEYHIDDDTIPSDNEDTSTTTHSTSARHSTTQSTENHTTQTTTESTTVEPEPTHSHSYSPTYGTTNVQQYASDGTTNDYNKPIYGTQQVEKTREVPVYETHMIDINGNDATANWENYGRAEWQSSGNWNDYASDYQNMKTWLLATIGSSAMSKQDVQVGTTTETYYETEEVVTGYEQLGAISKKTITGYTCSCGKSISVAKYVSQYGTPSGYYLDGEILVHN